MSEQASLGQNQLCPSRNRQQRSTPTPSTWTLFEEPYWLDCVAPGEWSAVEITRDGRVIARLPYVIRKKYGAAMLSVPSLTPWLGPWMAPSSGKYTSQLGEQHRLLRELVEQLPTAQLMVIPCAPEYTNLHALHSVGWSLRLKYTYRMEYSSNLELLWEGLSKSTRNRIKHASKEIEIVTEPDRLPNLINSLSKSFERRNQGHRVPSLVATLERVDSCLGSREQRMIFTAVDGKNRPCAAAFLVFDERHAFMLLRESDPELHERSANSLLMWEAIRFAMKRSLSLNFLGSMIPSIERFNRGFGARQVPIYVAIKQTRLSGLGSMLAELILHRRWPH